MTYFKEYPRMTEESFVEEVESYIATDSIDKVFIFRGEYEDELTAYIGYEAWHGGWEQYSVAYGLSSNQWIYHDGNYTRRGYSIPEARLACRKMWATRSQAIE